MGAFYGSVQVRGQERGRVVEAAEAVAREKGIKCVVGPEGGGWVGVYPENSGQDETVGEALAGRLGGDVMQVIVHDDDVMAYWLWREGRLVDSYWSKPGYFGEEQRGEQEGRTGDVEWLAEVGLKKIEEMRQLLSRGEERVFEGERLERFGKLMGMRNLLLSYEYFKEGDEPVRGRRQFTEVPREAVEEEKKARRAGSRRESEARKRLKAEGLLLTEVRKKELTPHTCAAADGVLVAWHGFPGEKESAALYRGGKTEYLQFGRPVIALASDAESKRVVMAGGGTVSVYGVERWQKVFEAEGGSNVVAMSADGRRVAYLTREEAVVLGVERGTKLWSESMGRGGPIALHPTEPWLVVADQNRAVVIWRVDGVQEKAVLWVGARQRVPEVVREQVRKQVWGLDPEAKRAEFKRQFASFLERMQQSAFKRQWATATPDQIAQVREQMWKNFEQQMERMKVLAAGGPEVEAGQETVMCAGVSRDGRWVWFGTTEGVRVYEWEKAVRASGELAPRWRYDSSQGEQMMVRPQPAAGYVYAIVEEAGRGGIVFGDMDGRLRRMDLGTGEVEVLLIHPEGAAISQMAMGRQGTEITLCVRAGFQGPRKSPAWWEVWSYERLRQAAAGQGEVER